MSETLGSLKTNEYTIKVVPPKGYDKIADQNVRAISGESIDVTFNLAQAPPYVIYGIRIDNNNADPAAVVYTDEAIGMTAGSNSWFDMWPFNEIYPCVLNYDGTLKYKLNKQDVTKKEDGTPVTLSNEPCCMVRFPQIWISVTKDTNYVYVKISNAQVDSTYESLNDVRNGNHKGEVYIGMFKASTHLSNELRSSPGVRCLTGVGLFELRARARRMNQHVSTNFKGWEVKTYQNHVMLQCLFLIFYKNRNSQAALGMGLSGYENAALGGSMPYLGANYGTSKEGTVVKFLWIEDIWGNKSEILEGLYTRIPTIATIELYYQNDPEKFSETHDTYTKILSKYVLVGDTYKSAGNLAQVQGTNATPFFSILPTPTLSNNDTAHYYCDLFYLMANSIRSVAALTAGKSSGTNIGIFALGETNVTIASTDEGSRICFI